ncbi:Gag polyprotein [Carex littledalei]|uniref:Gag polyprotein n=1 Tax=Carex littledalei TaxID=544730 RepID=A0A833RJL6_9POAL|nr:Gag polyprotein [Carex littledalei]
MATKATKATTAPATQLDATGDGWQVVRRRRRFPDHWRTPADIKIDAVKPYIPYFTHKTYAQAVSGSSLNSSVSSGSNRTSPAPTNTVSPPSSRPPTPPTPPGTQYFYSPHSPTLLRFPPLSSYPEWKHRCFNCCRFGHTAAKCRNPRKCGKCWADGHIARHCQNPPLNPASTLTKPLPKNPRHLRTEPLFEELLQESTLPQQHSFPEGRPKKIVCFLDREDSYFREIQRLSRAVIVDGHKKALLLEPHNQHGSRYWARKGTRNPGCNSVSRAISHSSTPWPGGRNIHQGVTIRPLGPRLRFPAVVPTGQRFGHGSPF